jgi:curved DNA-binding protein CbpA
VRAHFPRGRLAFYFIRRALDEMARARLLSVLCALLHGCRATHYATLGISRSASSAEIKRAYRKKALEHHPDKVAPSQREEAAERFKEIQEAYTTLSDPAARRRYDVGGETPFGRAGSSPFGHAPPPGFQHFQDFHFHQRPVVPPSRATRPFYVSLMELDRGCQRDFELKDTPITRLCDAWSDGFMGDAASAALYRTAAGGSPRLSRVSQQPAAPLAHWKIFLRGEAWVEAGHQDCVWQRWRWCKGRRGAACGV